MEAHTKFSDEEILRIYNEEYIQQHIGGSTLKAKYGVNFYNDFTRLGVYMRNNREKGRIYNCDSYYFQDIDSEEKAYWLGFCYADAYITHIKNTNTIRFGLGISAIDRHHLEKFLDAIHGDMPISKYEITQGYKVGAEYVRVIISDKIFVNNLKEHGLIERKSNIIEHPTGVPEHLIKHFIRGFMDANGSITITNKDGDAPAFEIKFCSTASVLTWIQKYLVSENVINREYPLRKRKPEHIVSAFGFGGNNQVKQFLDFLYSDATVWLDRKYERYKMLCELLASRETNKRVKQCEYCGCTDSSAFYTWSHDGDYSGKVLCSRHYQQLRKHGRIIPDKKDACDVCGGTYGLRRLTEKFGKEWYGKTICEKHYNQLYHNHAITDPTPERRGYNKTHEKI